MIDWSFEQVACDATGADINKLHIKNRQREIVLARYLCYRHLKRTTTLSLAAIGKRYGKDHASVFHGLRTSRGWIDIKDTEFLELHQYFTDNIKKEEEVFTFQKLNSDEIRAIQLMYTEGLTYKRIADYYNISKKDVKQLTIDLPPRGKKATDELRSAVIDSYVKTNLTLAEIEKSHGVSSWLIGRMVNNYKKISNQVGVNRRDIKK